MFSPGTECVSFALMYTVYGLSTAACWTSFALALVSLPVDKNVTT